LFQHKSPNGGVGKGPNWSPYGCHYYPDPTEFPEPNTSSLPEAPLEKGEQYFLDLAGNIKKVNIRHKLRHLMDG
jgi:hypothetical protein